jgi:hypothetical protein
MRWRLAVLTLLFSISLSSNAAAAVVLPEHNSVTYDRIVISSHEARKSGDKWIVVKVKLYGVKVVGEKFLNGTVQFSYDSHFKGDRADLGLRVPNSLNVAGSISKVISRGGYKQLKNDWGTTMYVGAAKWGRQSNMAQFLYGAKANSEQDYVMLAWMLANANDIIKYAVQNDTKMSSKAKAGWKKLKDFTRAAYGNVNNVKSILVQADSKTPPQEITKVAAKKIVPRLSFETRDFINGLESKNKQLEFQITSLNDRVLFLRKENEKLRPNGESPKASVPIYSKYRLYIQRVRGEQIHNLGYITLRLDNGRLFAVSDKESFMRNYLPSRVVGSYLDNGDFELLITSNFMRTSSAERRTNMSIEGNLNSLKEMSVKEEYSLYDFTAQAEKRLGAVPIAKIKKSNQEGLGCYNYKLKTFTSATKVNQRCPVNSIYIPRNEMVAKSLSPASKNTATAISNYEKRTKFYQSRIKDVLEKLAKATTATTDSLESEKADIKSLNDQVVYLKNENNKLSKKVPKEFNALILKNVKLTEQLADLNRRLLDSNNRSALPTAPPALDASLPLGFCVSNKLQHIYAVPANDSCAKPYVEIDYKNIRGFSQATGIEHIGTLPWVSATSLSNAQVKAIQYLLVSEGFSTSMPDGLLGPNTIKDLLSRLRGMGDDRVQKVIANQLYMEKNILSLLLTKAHLAEVKNLYRQTIESGNVITKKDIQIEQLSTKILNMEINANKQEDAKAYKLKVSELSGQIKTLNQQLLRTKNDGIAYSKYVDTTKKTIEAQSGQIETLNQQLLRTKNDGIAYSEYVDTTKKTIEAQSAEIKRLTNELAVAKVKSKNSEINDSSFMETLSEEWRPIIVDMPLTERLFCDLYHDFRIKKDQAIKSNNQIRVNLVHRSFQEDLDSLLPGGSLDQWIVKVLQVSQVEGGDAAIIAELPCDVLVGSGTMNTEEGSGGELSWMATIPYSSRLYSELAKVSIGDFVNVSGTFVQIEAFKSGRNETFYASNSIGKNPLVAELGLDKDLYLLDLAYFMMLR